ncbi:MAG: hypothetical protein M3O15_02485 [Acidobacteriota bacterium]|nr:hypothetical protein [Acidobacteriota bacterium]
MATVIVEAGRLEPASLFARFGFARNELLPAAEKWLAAKRQGRPAAKPSELQTYVHELTHYLQYTTTPYGLFLQYCRILQNHATINIVNALLAANCPIKQPLLYNLPDMPPDVAEDVGWGLALWLNVEYLVTVLNADHSGRSALIEWWVADSERIDKGQKPLRPDLLGLQEGFVRVQDSLASLFAGANQSAHEKGAPRPVYPDNIDRSAITAALCAMPNDRDRAIERLELGMSMLGDPWDVSAIIESAATAAEFWESDLDYDRFAAWANANVAPELAPYRTCLVRGLEAIETRDLHTFLASHMTLCELALFAPLLPQHAELRVSCPDIEQLLPAVRFARLLSSATRVAPMQGRTDHDRYVLELCKDLGWVHPIKIIKSAMDGPLAVSDPLSFIYLRAQICRAQRGSATFIGIDQLLFSESPAAQEWREIFDFVVVDYKDRTTYHRDKDFLQSMTTRYLSMQGLQAVMLGHSLTLAAPYSNSPKEKQWMSDWLRQEFKAQFRRDFPNLRYI